MNPLLQKVQEAGVVGAGGAGFPTYMKLDCQVDWVLANGAECEPLLNKDQMLMQHHAKELFGGMQLAMAETGAKYAAVGIKRKHADTIACLEQVRPENISLLLMDDVYPAGDEVELVFHATGKRIPAGGLPKEIGVVVNNVESFINVFRAAQGAGVTHTMVTVNGAVQRPYTAWLPVGMAYREAVALAGGATCADPVIVDGGPMMGRVTEDDSKVLTKASSGLLVLPRSGRVAKYKLRTPEDLRRIGKSACDQCGQCTAMCPRSLLGYPVKPHLAMRALQVSGGDNRSFALAAQACCECNLCSMWSCPEGLDPSRVCVTTKQALREEGRWQTPEQLQAQTVDVHPMREYRGVPTKRLVQRLELTEYAKQEVVFLTDEVSPERVEILLSQHIGKPAEAIVAIGDRVVIGQCIGRAAPESLSAAVHASIDGVVTAVGQSIVIERKTDVNESKTC